MDANSSPQPPAPTESSAKRGRRPRAPVSEKIAALQAQLAEARIEAREAEKAKAAIVGAALVAAMKDDPEFRSAAVAQLRTRVTNARDKAAIADLLI